MLLMSASRPVPAAEKQPPHHYDSTTMLHCGHQVLLLKSCIWLAPNIVAEKFNLGFVCPQNLFPVVRCLVIKVGSGKLESCFSVPFLQEWFLSCNPTTKAGLVQCSPYGRVMNVDASTFQVILKFLGSDSWIFGGIQNKFFGRFLGDFSGSTTLRQNLCCFELHLWIIFHTVDTCSPSLLEIHL